MNRKIKIMNIFSLLLLIYTIQFLNVRNISGEEPVVNNYVVPDQEWYFIKVGGFTENSQVKFEWSSDIVIQGREVSEDDYDTMWNLDLTSRSAYFESLTFTEGKFGSGRIIASTNGTIYMIFFNPTSDQAQLQITITYSNGLSPWAIGIISAIIAVITLSIIIYFTIKLRQQMLKEAEEEQELTPEQRYMG